MTKFNPESKEVMTFGESLGPAMEITEQEDASQYFKNYVAFIQECHDKEPRLDDKTAEQVARENLGYYAGYYDHITRLRVEKLFSCTHPIFGEALLGCPTAEEAFKLGEELSCNKATE